MNSLKSFKVVTGLANRQHVQRKLFSTSNQVRSNTFGKTLLVVAGGTVVTTAGVFYLESVSKVIFSNIVMPLLHCVDAETAHVWSIKNAQYAPNLKRFFEDNSILYTSLWGRKFRNCIGIAAGYDKHAEAIDPLFSFGAGFVEIGSVTPKPQVGNEKPRMFRLPADGGVINRYGFNSDGLDKVEERLNDRLDNGNDAASFAENHIFGVNLGKNKETEIAKDDYIKGIFSLGPYADYIVINVSSPNTPGLRSLQGRKELMFLLKECQTARNSLKMKNGRSLPPLLVKIAPDLTENDKIDIAAVVTDLKIDGMIISNTTISRPDYLQDENKTQGGGLSGKPVFDISTKALRDMYILTKGTIPIIGVGGVSSGADAYQKVINGASLVQLYSSLGYAGPHLINDIKRDLSDLLLKNGFRCVADAVGSACKNN